LVAGFSTLYHVGIYVKEHGNVYVKRCRRCIGKCSCCIWHVYLCKWSTASVSLFGFV